jgi:FMN phosphatase YigB (HAD superfamily)
VTAAIAVGFDLGETLCEYSGVPLSWIGEYPVALALVAEACLCELTPTRLQLGKEVLLRYNSRVTPRPQEREYTAEHIFQELLLAWEVRHERLASAVGAFFGHFSARVCAFPESLGVICHLQERGVPIAVLTDVPYGMPVELVRSDLSRAGLPMPEELLITSTMVGHRKPHPAGFRALAQRLGVACSDLLYVGNEPKDIEGGKAAGCRTALVWRTAGDPPAWGQDSTIRSLDELRQLRYARK